MFLSQGPIYDRTNEQLCSADGAVIRVRQLLLKAAKEFMEGKTPTLAHHPDLNYPTIQSVGGVLAVGTDWRTLNH
jgi:phthalate 4,5-dioxygenase oxygenase subunit